MSRHTTRSSSRLHLLPLLCLVGLLGCGVGGNSPEDWNPSDQDQVRQVISDVSGARSRPEKLSEVFSQLPTDEWLEFSRGKSFELISIDVDGEQASVTMSIQDFDGNELSQQQWKCLLDGEVWKVADAPLGN